MTARLRASHDETAVSAVVGAVLLLALFSTAFTVYCVTTLPEWKADKEQVHQGEVRHLMGGLKADLEALAARRDPGPVTATIPLQVPRVPLLQPAAATGAVSIAEDGLSVTGTFASPLLYFSDGAVVGTPSALLTDAPCTTNVACIQSVDDFVLALTTTGVDTTGDAARVTLSIDDADADTTADDLVAYVEHRYATSGTCTGDLRLVVGATTHTLEPCTGAALTSYQVDLLDDDVSFASALARLEEPIEVRFTSSSTAIGVAPVGVTSFSPTYLMAFAESDGLVRVKGTSTTAASNLDLDTARLTWVPSYQSYPNQDLAFENGALIVAANGNDQAMGVRPSFDLVIDSTAQCGSLSWTLVELQGVESAVSGADEATVSLTYEAIQDMTFTTTSATFSLDGDTAAGWQSFLTRERLLSGSATRTTVSGTTDPLTFTLNSCTGTTTNLWVVHLRIITATVAVS